MSLLTTQPAENHIITRENHCVSRDDITKNALSVLQKLSHANFSAYLVGGSVRDLLLRHKPKDFDVATNATPEEIAHLFRNCRLIGRRFRLAHIYFGRDIIEVATFRAGEGAHPEEHRRHHEGLILKDNVYGTLEEDAWRRDFTVNALYYSINDFTIVDYVGGFEDLKQCILRIIGSPELRFREDPVRIIRAIRFAAKLDFTIEHETEKAMLKLVPDLKHVSPARLYEEILKLFHSGYAVNAYHLLKKYHLMEKFFEQAHASIKNKADKLFHKTLENTDKRVHEDKPITPAFLFASFLWFPLQEKVNQLQKEGMTPYHAIEKAISHILHQQRLRTTIPKRLSQVIKEIWFLQYRLPRRYGKRPFVILKQPRFRAAYDFLLLRSEIDDAPTELADWWTQFQEKNENEQLEMINHFHKQQQKKK